MGEFASAKKLVKKVEKNRKINMLFIYLAFFDLFHSFLALYHSPRICYMLYEKG